MSGRLLRVVKVGGSLLDFPELREALREFVSQPAAATVIVAGGGPLADAIREAHGRFGFTDEDAHWLAVRTMSVTAHLLHALLPDAPMVASLAALRAAVSTASLVIVDPEPLLRSAVTELGPDRLPHDWSVTSDSIAARIGEVLAADELVLLKSATPPAGTDWQKAAEAGFVDGYFPVASANLSQVRTCGIR
jgi:aspartokinase-like uncharacterized kinase